MKREKTRHRRIEGTLTVQTVYTYWLDLAKGVSEEDVIQAMEDGNLEIADGTVETYTGDEPAGAIGSFGNGKTSWIVVPKSP